MSTKSIGSKIQELRHILYRVKVKLWHNSAVGKKVRHWLWRPLTAADGLEQVYCKERILFDDHTMMSVTDPQIIKRYTWENETYSRQQDVIYHVSGELIVEPHNSLVFKKPNLFLAQTRSKAHAYLVPSHWKQFRNRLAGNRFTPLQAAIHFDGFVGRNLYHFYDDGLNPLWMLIQSGTVDTGLPILIHERIWNLPFAQFLLTKPPFNQLNWKVQQAGEWIRVKDIYKPVSSFYGWKQMYDLMGTLVAKKPHRRVFLNRKPQFQRRLINNDRVEAMLRDRGFEVIYAEDLSYEQQVQLFADVQYLVSMHGAGLTNLIFSDLQQVGVIELFAEDLLQPHFYWMLQVIGLKHYDAVLGSPLDINWNYTVDETLLATKVDQMLQNEA